MTLFDEAEARWIDRKFEELDEKLEDQEREEPEGCCYYCEGDLRTLSFDCNNHLVCDDCKRWMGIPHWKGL
jgi:hypothetical protein